MGKRDPAYWREWRAAHPEYRDRERARSRARDRGDRTEEYRRTAARRRSRAIERLPELFPDLVRGAVLVFREEDLARDLRQEAELARIEGRDVDQAVATYARRERAWWTFAVPFLLDDIGRGRPRGEEAGLVEREA